MAPILPFLTDTPEQLETVVRAAAAAGARSVTPIVLHLRPGAREWYLQWLAGHRPDLLPAYEELYGRRAYAPKAYQKRISDTVTFLATQHGFGTRADHRPARTKAAPPPDLHMDAEQLTLL
jgi:DNA repair photolyase